MNDFSSPKLSKKQLQESTKKGNTGLDDNKAKRLKKGQELKVNYNNALRKMTLNDNSQGKKNIKKKKNKQEFILLMQN